MKDFHDLLLLCRNSAILDIKLLIKNIKNTFTQRNTSLDLPINFNSDNYQTMQRLWSAHLRTLDKSDISKLELPEKIELLVQEVNDWLNKNII